MSAINADTGLGTMKSKNTMRVLTLRLQDEIFAIEATNVREILDVVPITEVPNANPFVGGLINVRGRVVPLADLRVMFGMDQPPCDAGLLHIKKQFFEIIIIPSRFFNFSTDGYFFRIVLQDVERKLPDHGDILRSMVVA